MTDQIPATDECISATAIIMNLFIAGSEKKKIRERLKIKQSILVIFLFGRAPSPPLLRSRNSLIMRILILSLDGSIQTCHVALVIFGKRYELLWFLRFSRLVQLELRRWWLVEFILLRGLALFDRLALLLE